MRKIIYLLVTVSIMLILFGCSQAKNGLLPQAIGNFELADIKKGEQAKQSVSNLHGKKINLIKVEIGNYYYKNFKAICWISRSKNNSKAKILMKRMTNKIAKGTSPFGLPKEITLKGIKIIKLKAMGQNHYFYQAKDKVVWLSVDSSQAKKAIVDLTRKVN